MLDKGASVLLEQSGTWKQSGSPTAKFSVKSADKLTFWVFMEVSLYSHE